MNELITAHDEQTLQILANLEKVITGLEKLSKSYKPPFNGERYFTDKELSEHLHVSRRTLQEWRNNGLIDYIPLGGKILYSESSIQKLLNKHFIKSWI
ncbi:MAG: helix-turn-helix domain-containing protein [Rikenellaceae bacterium]